MNSDEIKSLAIKMFIMAITPIATKYHIDGNWVPAVAADVADLIVLGYGVYRHWNMKTVPETSTVIPAAK